MKKYLAVLLLVISTHTFADNYICKQAGYQNPKTNKYVESKLDIFLTVVPESRNNITITRIDKDGTIPMLFTLREVKKNTTDVPGEALFILTSNTLEEPVRARMIGPNKEDKDSMSSVVDLVTESFLKEYKTYEERYFCIQQKEKLEQI